MKQFLITTLLACFISSQVFAQIEYEKRIELELKDGFQNENVIEFGKSGFLIQSMSEDKEDGEREWRFQKYNTDLEKIQTEDWKIGKKYFLNESFTTDDRHFVLFSDNKDRYVLGSIGIEEMKFKKVDGELPNKSRIYDMVVMGDFAYSKAYIRKEPVLFIINWKTGKQSIIPIIVSGYKGKNLNVQNLQVLEEANEVLLYILAVDSRKKSDLIVLRMDGQGKKKAQFNLTKNVEENISDISAYKLNDKSFVFTGTYTKGKVTGSQGLFYSQTTNNKLDYIQLYNFLDLEEFLSYLPEKKEEKVEKKKKRKEAKGKELKLNYQIADHDIIEVDGGYIFLGEAYYATYYTDSYTTWSTINGVSTPVTRTRSVFDGYQYTHAVIAKFDKSGKLLWDHTFELYQASKPYYVKRFINISESDSQGVKFVYSSRNKIVSKYIDYNGDILLDEESDEIETDFKNDKTKWSNSNLSYWYDNYFIAYGSQKIKNKEDKSADRKRRVLFVNKIKY